VLRRALPLAALALFACDEKRMGRSPEKHTPPPVPYEAHYPMPSGTRLKNVRMNAGETQTVALEAGTKLTRTDNGIVELAETDGGVNLKALHAGAVVIEGKDARGLDVQLPVQVFPPLK